MICERWDVVVVPFPFCERPGTKRRPALVVSGVAFNQAGHTVLAMITTAAHHPWPDDVAVEDLTASGLPRSCVVRLKLFTLDNRLLARRLGRLGASEREAVAAALARCLGDDAGGRA